MLDNYIELHNGVIKQKERGEFIKNPTPQDIGGDIEDEANAVAGQLVKKFVKAYDCRWIYGL